MQPIHMRAHEHSPCKLTTLFCSCTETMNLVAFWSFSRRLSENHVCVCVWVCIWRLVPFVCASMYVCVCVTHDHVSHVCHVWVSQVYDSFYLLCVYMYVYVSSCVCFHMPMCGYVHFMRWYVCMLIYTHIHTNIYISCTQIVHAYKLNVYKDIFTHDYW